MNPPISQLITMPEWKTLEFMREISDCRNVFKMSINLRPNELWPKSRPELWPELGPSWDYVGTKSGSSRDQVIFKSLNQSSTQLHRISSSQNAIKSVTKQVGEQVTKHVAFTNHRDIATENSNLQINHKPCDELVIYQMIDTICYSTSSELKTVFNSHLSRIIGYNRG